MAVFGAVSTIILLKIIFPIRVKVPVPAPEKRRLFKVSAPPMLIDFADDEASLTFISDVFAVSVRPVTVARLRTNPVPPRDIRLAPNVKVLVFALLEERILQVTATPFKFKLPFVNVSVLAPILKAS